MGAGDVVVNIVDSGDTALIDSTITGMRNTANDKWLMCSISNGLQVLIVNIEEA